MTKDVFIFKYHLHLLKVLYDVVFQKVEKGYHETVTIYRRLYCTCRAHTALVYDCIV